MNCTCMAACCGVSTIMLVARYDSLLPYVGVFLVLLLDEANKQGSLIYRIATPCPCCTCMSCTVLVHGLIDDDNVGQSSFS